jgi:hypothetical protein
MADSGPDSFRSRPSPGFVGRQGLVDVAGFAQQLGQGDSGFDRHGGALRQQRPEPVGRVADQRHAAR